MKRTTSFYKSLLTITLFILTPALTIAQVEEEGGINFIDSETTPFTPLILGKIELGDFNGDGLMDFLSIGSDPMTEDAKLELFINNGDETFTQDTDFNIENLYDASITIGDINNDGAVDIICIGNDSDFIASTSVYFNDGTGHFSIDGNSGNALEALTYGSSLLFDYNNDGFPDLLAIGLTPDYTPLVSFYKNNNGVFETVDNHPFETLFDMSAGVSEPDSDGEVNIILLGTNDSGDQIANLYRTNNGLIELVNSNPFEGASSAQVMFIDIDGDAKQDVIISGYNDVLQGSQTKLYRNNGNGLFTEDTNADFLQGEIFAFAFADVDGDLDQDVLIAGMTANGPETNLFVNDGSGQFELVEGLPFTGLYMPTVAFLDADGDLDQDVIIAGMTTDNEFRSKLYLNQTVLLSVSEEAKIIGKFYPNPVNSILKVTLQDENSLGKTLEIGDTEGRIVYKQEIKEKEFTIDFNEFQAGIYIIRIDQYEQMKILRK